MREKSFNTNVPALSPAYLAAGVAAGLLACLFAVPAIWETAAAVWNPISEILGAATRDGLPALPCPRLSGLGPIEQERALDAAAGRTYRNVCAATAVGCLLASAYLSLVRYERHNDGTWAGPSPAPGPATHGSGRVMTTRADVRRGTRGWRRDRVPEGGTVVVGAFGSRELRLIDPVHACVLGRSGDGKSRRIVAPTVMANVLQGRTVVVNDVKGELGDWIEPWARSLRTHRVVRLRLDDPAVSTARWDPMARARALAEAGDLGGATVELERLAVSMLPAERGDSPFFTDAARRILTGLMLYVLTSPDVPDECRNLSTAAALVTATAEEGQVERLESLKRTLPADSLALTYLGIVSGERGGGPGAITTAVKALTHFVDPRIDLMLFDDTLRLDRLGEFPTLVFLTTDSSTGDRSTLVNTLFSQTLASLRACARRHGGRLPVPAVLVMDEFASIGRCERLLQDIGEVRSEGITVVACWQSLHQLQGVSGYSREEALNLLDQFQSKVVLSCGDHETAETLSRTIGSYTVLVPGQSQTRSATGGSMGTSDSRTGRRVLSADEIMRWDPVRTGVLLVAREGAYVLESHDIADTFCADMLGMGPDGSGDGLRRRAFEDRLELNVDHAPVWHGPVKAEEDEEEPAAAGAGADFVPEGF